MGWNASVLAGLADVSASPVEGDMLYRNDSGLWVVVGGTKGDGKAPMGQADGSVQWETPSGGSSGGRTLIDSDDLASDGQITISTIPGTHIDLELYLWARSDSVNAGDGFEMQVGNGGLDTGSNYSWYWFERGALNEEDHNGDDTAFKTTGPNNGGDLAGVPFTGGGADAGHYGQVVFRFLQYADTDFHRQMIWHGFRRATSANVRRGFGQGIWQNTADAITDIKITPRDGTNFKSGSAWELYGVD